MTLPIAPPYEPMECRAVDQIPAGENWQYEPKWDGFRCLAFRDGDDVYMQSKSGQPLARYFPEVVSLLQKLKAKQFVLDGELMIRIGDALDFDALLQRIHPAASRAAKLAQETPAQFVIFDLLVDARGNDLTQHPLKDRRERLECFAKSVFREDAIALSPATLDLKVVRRWFDRVGNALDGVVAKRRDLRYGSGVRDAAQKIKHYRSADCVIGGYRLNKQRTGIGSLLLGLYDAEGLLNHVGFTSGFKDGERGPLLARLRKLEKKPGFTGSAPGGPNRWTTSEEPWFPLDPKLVVEVSFDHAGGERFRHGTKILRWRPDKAPRQCTMDQLLAAEAASPLELLG
jgi:ATP-dependent DNA ligase